MKTTMKRKAHHQTTHVFDHVPTEVMLHTFSMLDIPTLAQSQRVSKKWLALTSDEKVWRKVAASHCLLPCDTLSIDDVVKNISPSQSRHLRNSHLTLDTHPSGRFPEDEEADVDIYSRAFLTSPLARLCSNGYFDGLTCFQDLCKRFWCLERTWQPHSPSNPHLDPEVRSIDAAPPIVWSQWNEMDDAIEEVGRDVWRIKVCPADNVLISTGQRGGVRVVDIETGRILWRLDNRLTRRFPHVEYDRGYMVLDRIGHGNFEVWSALSLDGQERRGAFELYATLNSPRPIRALRFQYPYLGVASQDGHVLFWDVPQKKLVQTISLEGTPHVQANVNYIDFDDDWVFLVGVGAMCFSVLSRSTERVVFSLAEYLKKQLPPPRTFVLQAEEDPSGSLNNVDTGSSGSQHGSQYTHGLHKRHLRAS